jgi:hypothetical protein
LVKDATDSSIFAVEKPVGLETTGIRWKVRWRDWIDNLRIEVSGFGQEIRAVTAEIVPEHNLIGRSVNIVEFMASMLSGLYHGEK